MLRTISRAPSDRNLFAMSRTGSTLRLRCWAVDVMPAHSFAQLAEESDLENRANSFIVSEVRPSFKCGAFSDFEGNEGELAVALRARHPAAHSYAFQTYSSYVAQACRNVLRGSSQIEDVVQTVFESLWEHPARFDPERGSLKNYLAMQARNRCIDTLRSECAREMRALHVAAGATRDTGFEEQLVESRTSMGLRPLVQRLKESERIAVELAFFHEMSYRDVALKLNLPEGTVKSRIRTALRNLQRMLSI